MSTNGADGKSALVVVDMQNDYCHDAGTYPRNGFKCFDIEHVVNSTVSAVVRCKEQQIPVIYIRMAWNSDAHGYPIDAGLIVDKSRPFLRHEGLRRGTWGAEMLAQMPQPDYVIEKTRYSGFHNTALEALLRETHSREDLSRRRHHQRVRRGDCARCLSPRLSHRCAFRLRFRFQSETARRQSGDTANFRSRHYVRLHVRAGRLMLIW